jgi:hypothetical protein
LQASRANSAFGARFFCFFAVSAQEFLALRADDKTQDKAQTFGYVDARMHVRTPT